MSFTDDLRTLVRARYPVIWVQTHEEERVLRYVLEVAAKPRGDDGVVSPKEVTLWSQSQGFQSVAPNGDRETVDAECVDPIAAIGKVMGDVKDEPGRGRIVVMRDIHRFFSDTNPTYRFLRDAAHALKESTTTIIVTSPLADIPAEVEKDIVFLDLPLPTADELRVRLEEVLAAVDGKVEKPKNGTVEKVLKAGLGLSEDEFAGVVKESLIRSKKVDPRVVVKAKEQVIRKSGVVEMYTTVDGLESVGGLAALRTWVERRALAFSDKAAKAGLRAPRGLFLTGPPGTGKTLTAKAAANYLGVPLLWLKGDQVFSKYVGESEQNMTKVLKLADAVSPCVLFIDECEKLLAGSSGGGSTGDSGVSRRVFGSLLTYMQEHTTPVLVIATANDPLNIPPEMMSRFDAVFFVDMPQAPERKDIFAIHLAKKNHDPAEFDLDALAKASDGFCGREIEKVVNEALFTAFADGGRALTTADVLGELGRVVPLSKSRRNEVEAMRAWARVNAMPASVVERSAAGGVEL